MKEYQIKLSGIAEEQGTISATRMSALLAALHEIALGALHLSLIGQSSPPGRVKPELKAAADFTIQSLKPGSTILEIVASPFGETIPEFTKPDLFEPGKLHQETPISLAVRTINSSVGGSQDPEGFELDKSLVKKVAKFGELFHSTGEQLTISDSASGQVVLFSKGDFSRLSLREKEIPESRMVFAAGLFDVFEWSAEQGTIKTANDGIVKCRLSEAISREQAKQFLGQEVTISGKASYNASGNIAFVQIDKISLGSDGISYLPKGEVDGSIEQEIQKHRAQRSPDYSAIVGMWPGDETIEELLAGLSA